MQSQTIIGKQFPTIISPLIEGAKKSIRIVVFDWRWYSNDPGCLVQLFNQAIIRAARRGVKIEAICNNDFLIGVLKENGVAAKKITTNGIMHSKLMIIDDNTVVIGSHNYTQAAFTINRELSVALSDVENVADFNLFFEQLWQL